MIQLRILRRGQQLLVRLALIALFCGETTGSARGVEAPTIAAGGDASRLSSEGQAWLHNAIAIGNSPDLRWPDFSDYSKNVRKFYEFNGDSLWWVNGLKPTAQAKQLIALMRQADRKGLSAEDYDGSRWDDRLAKLRPAASQPTEADAVKFDLALTVCAMRHISDLHIGKVNPKHLDFFFDDESKKYDLPDFIKDHIVSGSDVAGALANVEPAYPGYRHTIQALQTYLDLTRKDDGEKLPEVKKAILPGDTYPGVPRLARLLRLVGDLPPGVSLPADAPIYQGASVDAVKTFNAVMGERRTGTLMHQPYPI